MNAVNTRKLLTHARRWSSVYLLLLSISCAHTEKPAQVALSEPPAAESPVAEPASEADLPQSKTTEEPLWTKLAAADQETYVVLLRHAIAPGTGDPANFQLDDCATQRNLSESGREQAKAIGEAFRKRDIPVTQVLSSQWCRCLETAELMDLGPVESFPALNSFFRDRTTAAAQTNQIQEYINSQDQPGVIVMVTHQVNITALTNIFPSSGSAVVLQPNDEDSQPNVIGQLLDSN